MGSKRKASQAVPVGSVVKLFALCMTALIMITGCSGSKEDQNQPAVPKDSSKPAETPVQGIPNRYDPPITLSTVGTSLSGATQYAPGEDMNNNAWTKYLLENHGIKVNTLWLSPTAQLEQKTNLMIASGEIPDFFLATPAQFVQLQNAGMLEDLTKVYAQVPQTVKKVIEDAGPEPMKAITINDKIMAIPFTGATKEAVSVLWVREDWLKKLNLSVPQSMNDVLAISEAFTNKDPDGNGKNDTYGLALDKEFYRAMGLMNGFHAYKGIWLKDASGKLAYSSIQPEMKTALSKLQEMFKSGQIDKEFGVKDLGKVNESFGTNKIGMFFGDIDSGTAPLRQQTPDVKWISLPVPSVDSKPTLLQHSLNINNGFWVVKKGVKNPEAILKMAEVWINMFYLNTTDEMYKKYVVGDGVSYWINSPIKLYKTFKNAGVATNLAPLLNSGKKATDEQLAKLTPEEKDVYGQLQKYYAGDKSFLYREAKFGLQGSANVINQYVKNNQFKPDQFIGTPPPAMAQKFANLQKLELEMFTKIVLGSASISEFDDFVAQWKKLGGEEITNELNQK